MGAFENAIREAETFDSLLDLYREAQVELSRLRAEVEKLRSNAEADNSHAMAIAADNERLGREVEKLRADLAWAVKEGVFRTSDMFGVVLSHSIEIDDDGEMCAVSVRLRDGTESGLLDAVRRAREGEA